MLDLWREDDCGEQILSWRKFGVLVQQLPPESATATALRLENSELPPEARPRQAAADPEAEQWSRLEQLVAGVCDELLRLRWTYVSAHSSKDLKWEPEPLPRPGVNASRGPLRKVPPTSTTPEVSALAAYLARTQGGEATYN